MVRWQQPHCGKRNGIVTSYDVKLTYGGVTIVHNTKRRMATYTNFHVGQQFSVQVRAVTAQGVGPYGKFYEGLFGKN